MSSPVWRVAADVDPKSLGEARNQTQNAVHWMARLANSYLSPEPEHRHVWMRYDAGRGAIVTRPFAGDVSIELRLPTLELQFRENDRPVPHILHVEGHSPAKVEAWVLVELLHRGIDRSQFSKSLPYQASNLMSGDHIEYSPDACARELDELSRWLGNAEAVLGPLRREFAADSSAAVNDDAGLLCWPEQLHVGLLVGLEPGSAATAKALRVGLSAGDERYEEPYFFVAVQDGAEIEMPHPGAVLTASRIIGDRLDDEGVRGILRSAITNTRRRLSN